MVAGLVAAGLSTSGKIVGGREGGVCQLLPESTVDVLLYERVHKKSGESVESHHRLHKVETPHVEGQLFSLKQKGGEGAH